MVHFDSSLGILNVLNSTDTLTRVTTFPEIANNITEFHTNINGLLVRKNLVIGRNFVTEEEED